VGEHRKHERPGQDEVAASRQQPAPRQEGEPARRVGEGAQREVHARARKRPQEHDAAAVLGHRVEHTVAAHRHQGREHGGQQRAGAQTTPMRQPQRHQRAQGHEQEPVRGATVAGPADVGQAEKVRADDVGVGQHRQGGEDGGRAVGAWRLHLPRVHAAYGKSNSGMCDRGQDCASTPWDPARPG